ncbi:MAG: hypothetical protein NW201_15310 [Gemmatimonadales bacterium]|nr:hypothetical protein [Gemmatimonadales bacterium]
MAVSEREKLERRYQENPQGLTFAPLADIYRKQGDAKRALELLRPGLELHPDYIPGSVVMGRCALDLGDDALAEEAFSRVLQLDAENVIALKAMADVTERGGRYAEAGKWLEALLIADRGNDEARQQLERVRAAESALAVGGDGAAEAPAGAPATPELVADDVTAAAASEPEPPPAPTMAAQSAATQPEFPSPIRAAASVELPDFLVPAPAPPPPSATVLEMPAPTLPPPAALAPFATVVEMPAPVVPPRSEPPAPPPAIEPAPAERLETAAATAAEADAEAAPPTGFEPTASLDRFTATHPVMDGLERTAFEAAADAQSVVEPMLEQAVEAELPAAVEAAPLADAVGGAAVEQDGEAHAPVAEAAAQASGLVERAEEIDLTPGPKRNEWQSPDASDEFAAAAAEPPAAPAAEPAAAPEPALPTATAEWFASAFDATPPPPAPEATAPVELAEAPTVAPEVPEPVAAAMAGQDPAPEPASAPSDPFVTETMAELFASQGHTRDALDVYERLLAQRPGDERLELRAQELRLALLPAAPAPTPAPAPLPDPEPEPVAVEPVVAPAEAEQAVVAEAEPVPASEAPTAPVLKALAPRAAPSVPPASHTGERAVPLAAEVVAPVAGLPAALWPLTMEFAAASAPPSVAAAPPPLAPLASVTGGVSVRDFFGQVATARPTFGPGRTTPAEPSSAALLATAADAHAAPTRPSEEPVSLREVFGDDAPGLAPAQGAGAFDDFFADGGRTPSATPAAEQDDLLQFRAWLDALKQ